MPSMQDFKPGHDKFPPLWEKRASDSFWPSRSWAIGLLALAVIVGATLRSVHLMTLFPVLVDEAIYLRWAEIIQHQHVWFISLLDAKPPLLFWCYAALRPIFPTDPLLGTRLVSVIAGSLTVIVLYRIGYLCGGVWAGITVAFMNALLPFACLYDRLGYVDSVVNTFGTCFVYACLNAYCRSFEWKRILQAGLLLGLGLFTKTTVALYSVVPIGLGLYFHRRTARRLCGSWAALYGVAALFPICTFLMIPDGPTASVNNPFFHHTSFFTSIPVLWRDPFVNLRYNGPLLKEYATTYIGWPTLIGVPLAAIFLGLRSRWVPMVILLAVYGPFLLVLSFLQYFPSRYAFPLAWPSLLVLACAMTTELENRWFKWLQCTYMLLVTGSLLGRSVHLISSPDHWLHPSDAQEFLGAGPYSGSGVRQAIAYLGTQTGKSPIYVLTDPYWGPPTDAVFAYLNQRNGIGVYEAWWIESEDPYTLVPNGPIPVWRSQYQRIADSAIDFTRVSPLYYVTDTGYRTPGDVIALAPNARLVQRFPKRSGNEFIDVYLLNP